MSVQEQTIQSHNHTMNHTHSITDPGHSHSYTIKNYADGSAGMGGGGFWSTYYTGSSTTGITINNYNGNTGDTGSTETRPVNYTYKIWKRIN